MFCLHLCKYSVYVCDSHRYQKGALDILEQELLTKLSYGSRELNPFTLQKHSWLNHLPTSKCWLSKQGSSVWFRLASNS